MDENNIRPERIAGTNVDRDINMGRTTTGIHTDYDRDVDIRRSMVMGRDMDTHSGHHFAKQPHHIHWGSIMAGLMTSLTTSVLLGALFLGLGFDKEYGVFGGLNQGQVGGGAFLAMAIGTFIGAYLCGYLAHVHSKLNGFMVGVTSILVPLVLSVIGAYGQANMATSNTVPANTAHHMRYSLAVAADNAWQVFLVGAIILGLATLAGYLGHKHGTNSRRMLPAMRRDHGDRVDHVNTY